MDRVIYVCGMPYSASGIHYFIGQRSLSSIFRRFVGSNECCTHFTVTTQLNSSPGIWILKTLHLFPQHKRYNGNYTQQMVHSEISNTNKHILRKILGRYCLTLLITILYDRELVVSSQTSYLHVRVSRRLV